MIFNIFSEPPCITEEMLVSMLIRLGHYFYNAAMEQKKQKNILETIVFSFLFLFVSVDY